MTLFDYWFESLGKENVEKMAIMDAWLCIYKEFRPVRNLSQIITQFDGAVTWDLTK